MSHDLAASWSANGNQRSVASRRHWTTHCTQYRTVIGELLIRTHYSHLSPYRTTSCCWLRHRSTAIRRWTLISCCLTTLKCHPRGLTRHWITTRRRLTSCVDVIVALDNHDVMTSQLRQLLLLLLLARRSVIMTVTRHRRMTDDWIDWDSRSTVVSARECTTWTPRSTPCAMSCLTPPEPELVLHPLRRHQCVACRRSRRCCSLVTTSWRCRKLSTKWARWSVSFSSRRRRRGINATHYRQAHLTVTWRVTSLVVCQVSALPLGVCRPLWCNAVMLCY